MKLVIVKGTF